MAVFFRLKSGNMSGSVVRFFSCLSGFSKILPDGGDTIFWKNG
jgi:hypothetical protein